MNDHIEVFVDGKAIRVYRGMRVKHALISHDYDLYRQAEKGEILIEDQNGFQLDLEGALHDNAQLFIKRKPS